MAILNIFEPNTLPIMKSIFFFLADSIADASSGKLDPIAVKDKPIT